MKTRVVLTLLLVAINPGQIIGFTIILSMKIEGSGNLP